MTGYLKTKTFSLLYDAKPIHFRLWEGEPLRASGSSKILLSLASGHASEEPGCGDRFSQSGSLAACFQSLLTS